MLLQLLAAVPGCYTVALDGIADFFPVFIFYLCNVLNVLRLTFAFY